MSEKRNYNQLGSKGITIIAVLFIVGLFFNPIIDFLVNILWFKSISYISVFWKTFYTKLKLFIPIGMFFSIIIYFYFSRLSKNYEKYFGDEINIKENKILVKIFLGSILGGTVFGYTFANFMWKDVLLFINGESFNIKDPIFNLDISFYVFKLPLIKSVLSMLIFLLFWMTLITTFYFAIIYRKKKIRKENVIDFNQYKKNLSIKQIFCSHSYSSLIRAITMFAVAIMVLIGINYFLLSYKLLYSNLGIIYGAGYTDVKVTLMSYRILSVLSFLAAIMIIFGYKKGNFKVSLAGPISILSLHIISLIIALVVQQLVVLPDEISKEKNYIKNNLEATQTAYGINDVDFIDYDFGENLDYKTVTNEKDIIENIMINDHRPLKQTFNEIQGIRLYYKFNDVDIDRYKIDGKYTQMFVSAREISIDKLRSESKTWLNRHFKYTHGYGFVMSPVNKIGEDGQPELFVKNIPPVSDIGINVKEPRIYFGELTDDYIIVKSDEYEFDYPSGDDNEETKYKGSAGVNVSGINKLLFSIKNSSMKLLFSNNINDESKIIFNRNIYKRLNKIAPFFRYDKNAYLVLNQDDGKLYWIIDGYTTTKNYPYSKPFMFNGNKINYMRNSIKVVIDAYEGSVDFYKFQDEPIVNAYDEIFPNLLKDKDEMPIMLKEHIRYPQDFFNLQARVYETFHVDNPTVFYNGEDVWQIANEKYMSSQEVTKYNPKYVTYRLPGNENVEFLLNIPFTPNDRGNMTALFAARNDGEMYGNLFVYKFPKDKVIKGPIQIENQIDQDSEISPQFTLWGQRGSSILRGNVIIIPINNSLLYIEPIYLRSDSENSLPEMKKVILFYNNKIVMEDTLDLSLKKMFDYTKSENMEVKDVEDLSDRQLEILNEINSLLEEYKKDTEKLEKLIDEFNELNKQ